GVQARELPPRDERRLRAAPHGEPPAVPGGEGGVRLEVTVVHRRRRVLLLDHLVGAGQRGVHVAPGYGGEPADVGAPPRAGAGHLLLVRALVQDGRAVGERLGGGEDGGQ